MPLGQLFGLAVFLDQLRHILLHFVEPRIGNSIIPLHNGNNSFQNTRGNDGIEIYDPMIIPMHNGYNSSKILGVTMVSRYITP